MTTGPDSVIMILHLKGDRVENVSSFDVSKNDGDQEGLDRRVAEAVRASVASGRRRTEKMQLVRNLATIAVTLFLISLIPLAIAATLLVRQVVAVASNVRQASAQIQVNRDSLVSGVNTLARHAEQLSPEREQQLLRDLNIIARRLQPYADTVRPLFTGAAK